MGSSPLRVAIVGSGIGGLAAAVALQAKGFEVEVFDQAGELSAIGAGIALGGNGMRVLDDLGVGRAARDVASNLQRIQFHHWRSGEIFYEHPMGDWYDERMGGPFLGIHRADMHQVLLDAYQGEPQLGRRAAAVHESPDGAEIEFADGTKVQADIVVGADGLRSAVRHHVAGPDEAVFSAMSCFRGLVPAQKVPGSESMGLTFMLGPGRHLVIYPVRGGELVNFVAYVPDPEWTLESWSSKSEPAEAVAAFDGWNDTVVSMLSNVQEVGRWALYDREPLRKWSTDRVTLLGDAAHPMLPHAGQGSNQAIEDAAALAFYLTADGLSVAEALQRYEHLRKARTRKIQMGSRGNAACFQVPDGPPADERNARLQSLPDNVAWIHGYDIFADLQETK